MNVGIQIANSVTIKAFIICEDVREEVRGKHGVSGILAGDIKVQTIPANIKMAWYVDFQVDDISSYKVIIRATADGSELVKLEGALQIPTPAHAILLVPSFILRMEKPGTLIFDVSVNDGPRVEIDRREVILDQTI